MKDSYPLPCVSPAAHGVGFSHARGDVEANAHLLRLQGEASPGARKLDLVEPASGTLCEQLAGFPRGLAARRHAANRHTTMDHAGVGPLVQRDKCRYNGAGQEHRTNDPPPAPPGGQGLISRSVSGLASRGVHAFSPRTRSSPQAIEPHPCVLLPCIGVRQRAALHARNALSGALGRGASPRGRPFAHRSGSYASSTNSAWTIRRWE